MSRNSGSGWANPCLLSAGSAQPSVRVEIYLELESYKDYGHQPTHICGEWKRQGRSSQRI